MSERSKKFSNELDLLIAEGENLLDAIQYDCAKDDFESNILKAYKGDNKRQKEYLANLPNFRKTYQSWYTKAMSVVKHIMPDRVSDFLSYYDLSKGRKEITAQNYMIRDYLHGLTLTRGFEKEVVLDGSAAIPAFYQQVNMLRAAKDALNSSLMDMKSVLQADLFDTEIETAGVLAAAGYSRAAGAICGVVIEKHLLHVCEIHGVGVRRKHPSISDLIQALKDADILSVPQWRYVQHLADIRNICDHAKGREPTKEEIADLVAGAEKVLKTIF